MANEPDFFAVCVSSNKTVDDGGFPCFCVDIGRAYSVDFDVFLILGREERFVDVGSCCTRKFERRIKFRRLVTNLNEKMFCWELPF